MKKQVPGLREQGVCLDAAFNAIKAARRMLAAAWIDCECPVCTDGEPTDCPLFKLSGPLQVAFSQLDLAGANGKGNGE